MAPVIGDVFGESICRRMVITPTWILVSEDLNLILRLGLSM